MFGVKFVMSVGIKKIDVAGLKINPITKSNLLAEIQERIRKRQKTFVVTPYSESLYASMQRTEVKHLLNSADFAIADGIGILWARLFLSIPFKFKTFALIVIQAWWQIIWTGASILLRPSLLYKDIPEKIVGADLIWDLSKLAEANNFSIYLLGSLGDTAQRTSGILQKQFPDLKIVGTSNKRFDDPSIIDDINAVRPDMIFVAFNPLVQEKWIADNLSKVTAAFGIALGGTFDYVAGTKKQPPKLIRRIGLEWLYRLVTQPSRIFRIYNGVIGLITALFRYKVYEATPYRNNACAVVINSEGKILVCKRTPKAHRNSGHYSERYDDYWQFPQGGLDKGEEIVDGALRELAEETGIVTVKVLGQAKHINSYEWNNSRRAVLISRLKYKGQSQKTVIFKFEGTDDEIHLDQTEFVDYKWVEQTTVLETLASERRPHAAAVLAELKDFQVN